MKGTSKNLKAKDVKNENENGKETNANESSTPEISARSRLSLDRTTAQREDEKEEQILQLQALLREQSQQLEMTQQALEYSQTANRKTRNLWGIRRGQPKAVEQHPANSRTKPEQATSTETTRPGVSSNDTKSSKSYWC